MDISGSTLNELSRIGDPVADEMVANLARDGKLAEVNRLFRQWESDDQQVPADLPEGLRRFLEDARRAPNWADRERLIRVHEFFQDDGLHIGTVLALGSMAIAYAVPLGAKMMGMTHRLRYPERRMANTGQFVFDLMQPEPFGPSSRFVVSAVKVRLIHATVRHHLRTTGSWDEDRDGVPASQEHLLIVWLALTVQVIDFLERLRIRVTPQEAEDYLHTWRVAGTFLGLRAESMPATVGEGRQMLATVLQRSAGPSVDGAELTNHLIDMYRGVVPGRMFDGIVPAMLRRLIGKDIADWLRVPHSPVWQTVIRGYVGMLGMLERVEDRSPLAGRMLDKMGRLMRDVELRILTRGKTTHLELPLDLTGYNPELAHGGVGQTNGQVHHAGDDMAIPIQPTDRPVSTPPKP